VAGALLARAKLCNRQLRIEGIVSLPSLPRLLSALLPPSPPACRKLTLRDCDLPLAALRFEGEHSGSTALAQLRTMSLWLCQLSGGSWNDALAALMSAAPKLKTLQLCGCLSGTDIPDSLRSATHLTSLSLLCTKLEEFPEAPVLHGGHAMHSMRSLRRLLCLRAALASPGQARKCSDMSLRPFQPARWPLKPLGRLNLAT